LSNIFLPFLRGTAYLGFVWNVNSFDQEGVQLGKILTKKVLSGNFGDSALEAFSKVLGI